MDQLTTLLDRAAGPAPHSDAVSDLARGRRALARSRRRRAAVAVLGVTAASVLVGAVAQTLQPAPEPTVVTGPSSSSNPEPSDPVTAGPFTFAAPPEGWSVQDAGPTGVTFAPDAGGVDDDPNSYVGKLVFYLENNKQRGEHTTYDGRDFWVRHSDGETPDPEDLIPLDDPADNSDAQGADPRQPESLPAYTMISTRIPGRDGGSLTVQYPDSTGFTEEQMVEFLASVEVGPGAELSYG